MAQAYWTRLSQRGVVEIGGAEASHFLQNLVTNDVDAIGSSEAGYGALLSPQGKVQFDFIIYRVADRFLIDLPRDRAQALVTRLGFYRLRAPVAINDLSDTLDVIAFWGEGSPSAPATIITADPRHTALGMRAIVANGAAVDGAIEVDGAAYHRHRIALGIPEGGTDFAYDDAFPHDADIDQLSGVAFAKGCYVGQEIVSRMEHRGTARRRIVKVHGEAPLVAGTELTAGVQPVGTVASVDDADGLALVRIDRAGRALNAGTPIIAAGHPVALAIPEWARFSWPTADDDTAS